MTHDWMGNDSSIVDVQASEAEPANDSLGFTTERVFLEESRGCVGKQELGRGPESGSNVVVKCFLHKLGRGFGSALWDFPESPIQRCEEGVVGIGAVQQRH
jgi:hypothetical protein